MRQKLKNLGSLMGFETAEEWTPPSMKELSRFEVYKPRIDLIWYKRSNQRFVDFLNQFQEFEFFLLILKPLSMGRS